MEQNKFFIFCQGRSGSTLLKHLLNSHPSIFCEGELFNKDEYYLTNYFSKKFANRFPVQYCNYRSIRHRSQVYGFTLLHYQIGLLQQRITQMSNNGWKIIHLSRKDAFHQSVSHFVARETNFWHRLNNTKVEVPSITIDPSEIAFWIKRMLKNKELEDQIMAPLSHAKLVYEDDLADNNQWQAALKRVFDYLEVDYHQPEAKIKKTYNRPYSEIVENYQEVREYLIENTIIETS